MEVIIIGVMNMGLQKHMLEKKLKKQSVEPDLIDVSKMGELDSTLHLDEQETQFKQKFPTLFPKEDVDTQGVEHQRKQFIREEARNVDRTRPPFRRMIDQSINAKTVFEDPSEEEFEMWKQKPNEMDILGVDTRMSPDERTKAKVPANRKKEKTLWKGSKFNLKKTAERMMGVI